MADGFDIHVGSDLARRLAEEAELTGQTPEAVALNILAEAFEPPNTDDLDWAEDVRRAEEYDRTGNGRPADEVFREIEAEIRARIAKKGLSAPSSSRPRPRSMSGGSFAFWKTEPPRLP